MLVTSTNVLYVGHNHLLTTGTSIDDPTLLEVSGHQYWWLASGYDLEIGHFLEVTSTVVTRWIVTFLPSDN